MEDLAQQTADAQRALNDFVAAMNAAAMEIENLLGAWLRDLSRARIDQAVATDVHRTRSLESAGALEQLRGEEDQITGEFPARIHDWLTRNAWRHLHVDSQRPETAKIMANLDYGIWQHSGYKIPPAYEAIINTLLGKVNQLLRKYGYRPEFGRMVSDTRHPAPPEAIPPMEQYYRLSMRLADYVREVESIKLRAQQSGSTTTTKSLWDH